MKTPRMGRACLPAALAALLGGCVAVGPDYSAPELAAPTRWSETPDAAEAAPLLEQRAWWQAFGDPQLNALIDEASRSNLDLAQARARIVQARSDLVIAGAARLPVVNASGSVTRSDSSNNTAASAFAANKGPGSVYLAGFDASWEIDVFGGVRRSVEAAGARVDASIESLHATRLTLFGELARNYIDLRSNQAQLDIARRSVEAQQQTADVTRERYRLGLTSYLDVAQADAQRATTASTIPTLTAAIKQSIHRLAILSGQEPNALKATLSAVRPLPGYTGFAATGLPSELLARRPDLRLAERKLAAASADIGVATAGLYPKFDLTLGLGLQSNDSSRFLERSSRYWSVIPGVSLPVFNGGRTTALIEGKRAAYDEALAAYRAAFNTALEDVENALAAYYAEAARRQTLDEAVSASTQAVTLAKDRYRRGLTTFLDVLTAENALFTAERSLSQSKAGLLTDLVSLHKALGGGWNTADAQTDSSALARSTTSSTVKP